MAPRQDFEGKEVRSRDIKLGRRDRKDQFRVGQLEIEQMMNTALVIVHCALRRTVQATKTGSS
jgi:hypothetical protein